MKNILFFASLLYFSTSTYGQNVGIGTVAPKSKLDVTGGISAGSYAGTTAAPTNGAIISGRVGIGTAAPLYQLHILHSAITDGLMIQNTVGGATGAANLFFATYADVTAGTSRPGAKISAIDDGNFSAQMTFSTKVPGADANAMTERMRINSVGNVGIGTTVIPNESNLVLGPTSLISTSEGGEIQLDAGTAYTTAYFIDNYSNTMRFMQGTNTGSSQVDMLIEATGDLRMNNLQSIHMPNNVATVTDRAQRSNAAKIQTAVSNATGNLPVEIGDIVVINVTFKFAWNGGSGTDQPIFGINITGCATTTITDTYQVGDADDIARSQLQPISLQYVYTATCTGNLQFALYADTKTNGDDGSFTADVVLVAKKY